MANPTTNYGWPMPTSADLVTDLPADFALFGQPVDTSLKALNPETTLGDIAYRSATSNTNTRLGIGTNGQVLAVSGGVPAWTTTADVTPLTTKGDLFTFTTVDARLGVGTNGQVLQADSAEATGLKWATPSTDKTYVSVANGNIATGVSTTTISGLSGYDDIIILLYSRVTTANNVTYNLTMNNTTTYFGSWFRSDTYGTGNDSAGSGGGFQISALNYAGTSVSNDYIHIRGCKSTGIKTYEYIFASGYLTQHFIVEGYTNSTAAFSSLTITSNGTLNGGTYKILGA